MDRPSDGPAALPRARSSPTPRGKRLFISDTGHNRIVQAGLDGKDAVAIGDGEEGFEDGAYEKARFNRPQGMYLDGETLYVADTENHAIRAVDLKARQVSTVAGTGKQMPRIVRHPVLGPGEDDRALQPLGRDPGPRRRGSLYIAMAGPHQIWKLDLPTRRPSASSPARATRTSWTGRPQQARFAQPSGLATDGENLFVADSEVSGVRMITGVRTPGADGADDRRRGAVRVRRPRRQGGAASGSSTASAWRTATGSSTSPTPTTTRSRSASPRPIRSTRSSARHKAGDSDDPPHFYEPGGTERGRRRAVRRRHQQPQDPRGRPEEPRREDPRAAGISAPRPAPRRPSFPNATVVDVPAVEAAPGESVTLEVSLDLPGA